jgi:hypothetical protein
MFKLTTRLVLSVLISLGIIIAVFVSVKAASANLGERSLGMYVLGGGLVNQLQVQSASDEAQKQTPLQEFAPSGEEGDGHGCESENYVDPNDL